MAIPFFIFAGELMFHGGIARRLVNFASAAVGAVASGVSVFGSISSKAVGLAVAGVLGLGGVAAASTGALDGAGVVDRVSCGRAEAIETMATELPDRDVASRVTPVVQRDDPRLAAILARAGFPEGIAATANRRDRQTDLVPR